MTAATSRVTALRLRVLTDVLPNLMITFLGERQALPGNDRCAVFAYGSDDISIASVTSGALSIITL